jgi:nicotinate-nucleotide pyrophosphorylase (carboxylating)
VTIPLPPDLRRVVERALREDLGSGDLTTGAVIPPETRGEARFVARREMVVCGLPVVAAVFDRLDPTLDVEVLHPDGTLVAPGQAFAVLRGRMGPMLTGERVALNFAQRLSGVATLTRSYIRKMAHDRVRLVDTRKTTPGIRSLEKYAVRVGGGHNHRFGLDDGVMIKDNHIAACGGVGPAVRRALDRVHHLVRVQVEVECLEQAVEAVEAGARVLLLDNFDPPALAEVVAQLRRRPEELVLEASGGITIDTVAAFAATGVDVISCGALIHQARWIDIGLDIEQA